MDNVISQYQNWKKQGESLRAQARHAMETRFREVLTEAVQIAQEYQADFGAPLKPPPSVTAFRFKPGARAAVKKTAKAKGSAKPQPKGVPEPVIVVQPPSKADPKVTALQKRLAQAQKKLDAAKAAGAPTKNLEDKIYELEDDLRLATSAG